jgi:hypothetical protein
VTRTHPSLSAATASLLKYSFVFSWVRFFHHGAWLFLVSRPAIVLILGADLLYKDYQTDHKFTLTTYTANNVVSATSSSSLFLHCG